MGGWRAWFLAAVIGLGAGVAVGGWASVPTALIVAAGVGAALQRIEPRAARQARAAAAAALPIAADLLAAALRAGAAPDVAALVVGDALGGPVGVRLATVARALRLGLPPDEAWGRLSDLPGGERIARAAVRTADSGVALSRSLDRLAEDLRADRSAAADAAAHRAGVLAVLPLGLCFLPAFLLTGVVPVVVAVLGHVLRT